MIAPKEIAPCLPREGRTGRGALLCTQAQQIGDIVMGIPVIRRLAKLHGGSIDLLVKSRAHCELYAGLPFFGQAFYLTHWKMPFWLFPSWWRFGRALKRRGYETIYALETNPGKQAKIIRLAHLFGIERRCVVQGMPAGRFDAMGLPELRVLPEEKAAMERRLADALSWRGEPIVLVHPGNSRFVSRRKCTDEAEKRIWREENWAAAAAGVAETLPEAKIIFTGSACERELTLRIAAGGKNVHSWAGQLSLRELLALQSLAHSHIANDTGPAHTALALGCPSLILYIAKDPRNDRILCPKGWGPAVTIRSGFTRDRDGESRVHFPIRPDTVVDLWKKLPPRPSTVPLEYSVTHYLEGDPEGETIPS